MMGTAVYLILVALAMSGHSLGSDADGHAGFYSKAADQDVWPDLTVLSGGRGGFLGQGLLQPPSLHELERNFPVPLHTLDFMNAGPSFAIKVMNSSWSGLAGADVYQRGELVYLQVTSDVPDPELYIHSCYAAPSPNPTNKSRYALILNKGCVSSKQPMLKYVSRQSDSINLVLNTSSLKFLKMYVHCSVVLSSQGLTQNTKSCNYIESKSRWVDLSGQSDVCDCCATKCRSPPYYEGLFSELRTVVSVGPLTIKEHEKQLSVSNSTSITASQIGASAVSTRKDWIVSGASPSVGKGWIASGASVSGSSVLKHPSLMPQPVTADLIISQEQGGALSFSLPGLVLDVQPFPALEMGVVYPQQKGRAKVTMLSGPADSFWAKPEVIMQEHPSNMLPQLESRHWEFVNAGDVLVADAPNFTSAEPLDMPEPVLDGFRKSEEEELRGDVFTNFRELQLENIPPMKNSFHGLRKDRIPEGFQNRDDVLVLTQTETLFKMVKADAEAKPDSVKQSKLTLSKVSDGSSLLSFEEEERSPDVGEEAVRKTTFELKRSKMEDKLGEERSKQLDTETKLVSSLLDLLRGMKMQ